MAHDRTVRKREDGAPPDRRYVVICDDCSYEEQVDGTDRAQATALDHSESTDHEVVALEVPATT